MGVRFFRVLSGAYIQDVVCVESFNFNICSAYYPFILKTICIMLALPVINKSSKRTSVASFSTKRVLPITSMGAVSHATTISQPQWCYPLVLHSVELYKLFVLNIQSWSIVLPFLMLPLECTIKCKLLTNCFRESNTQSVIIYYYYEMKLTWVDCYWEVIFQSYQHRHRISVQQIYVRVSVRV